VQQVQQQHVQAAREAPILGPCFGGENRWKKPGGNGKKETRGNDDSVGKMMEFCLILLG